MTTVPQPTAPAADVLGRARALSVLTSLRWYGPVLLRLRFALTRLIPGLVRISDLRSVYFTRWTILRSIPYNGPPQSPERATSPSLLWESAFSAPMDPYIESFVQAIGGQIQALWSSSRGFPGTTSVADLRDYIEDNSTPGAYWYSAYPTASVRMVLAALEIQREHAFLQTAARDSSPGEFENAYHGFLTRQQGNL